MGGEKREEKKNMQEEEARAAKKRDYLKNRGIEIQKIWQSK